MQRLGNQPAPPAQGSPAGHQAPTRHRISITGDLVLWRAARLLVAAQARDFFKYWRKAADSFDPEDIHDLRVGSRRLREALALFGPCFPERTVKRLRRKVRQVTALLGELRNTDEALLFFGRLTPEEREATQPQLSALVEMLELDRAAARRELERDLAGLRPAPLEKGLRAALAAPLIFGNPQTDPLQRLAGFAEAAVEERTATVADLLPQALFEANAGAQHRLRIAVKHLRYRMEILEPLFRTGYRELHDALKGFQEVLGQLHDLDVFAELALKRSEDGAGLHQLLTAITARRGRLFREFRNLQDHVPLERIGTRARRAL